MHHRRERLGNIIRDYSVTLRSVRIQMRPNGADIFRYNLSGAA